MKKKEKEALVMGLIIGLIIGVFSTYLYMKSVEKKIEEENEKEKISITEKLSQEIAKLSLKNSAYTFVDTINSRIKEINEKEEKKVVKGTYVMKEDGIFYEADEETTEFINGGAKIDSLKFEDKKISVNSIVIINDATKTITNIFLPNVFILVISSFFDILCITYFYILISIANYFSNI